MARRFRLLLGGPFAPPALLEEMKAQPGWKNVEYAGPLSRAQVVDMLRRSAVGLVTMHNSPNYAEALPVKMFEYMAAGIPVVTNGIPRWKKIAEENHCGVAVDIEDTAAFRSAVEALLNDPQRCMELGKNGRRAVEEKFNWTVEERKLIALYRDLAGHD
jgi:glycosyltransferase involved in cell wall biosynthesis